jgi:hypothetical protein
MERLSMEPDQDHEPSSCEAASATAPQPTPEEEKIELTEDDREVARTALVERMARKHPERPAPRWFEAGEVALVATCASALEGDRATKTTAMSDAIAGAFMASKKGPPTVRFVWEKLDHFLDHVERGRRRRLAQERAAPHATEWPARPKVHAGAASMPAEVAAELEKLFGPGWRMSRVPR